jgi:hypothetical protein
MNQNEEIQWEALNSILPNDPDKWRKPALNEKKAHTDDQIKDYLLRVEDAFNLPLGVLSMPGKGTINGHRIPEVKRVAFYHLTQFSKASFSQLAPHFGVKRVNLHHYISAIDDFKDTNDETFSQYYSIIQNIAV